MSLNLINKKVVHKTFGKGNVVNYDDSYVNIDFESGIKKFIFPDVFGKYITLIDERTANLVEKKIEKREEELRKEELRLQEERALEEERQRILEEEKRMRSRKIHPKLQSVFWCEPEEEEKVFEDWKIFIGEIKSGKKKGEPRRLARMNQNSGCLLTRRKDDASEKDRHIIGVFMVEEGFNGKSCEDGYIPAHPEYRLRLSEEESEKMLFWNYYVNKKSPETMIWNSGRQRYFDNVWMAQILRDIVSLREEPKEKEKAQVFFQYFCKINRINIEKLPEANGALMRI